MDDVNLVHTLSHTIFPPQVSLALQALLDDAEFHNDQAELDALDFKV